MRLIHFLLIPCIIGITTTGWAGATHAGVKVSFDQPERFTDAGLYGEYGAASRAATLGELRTYLERLGARYLRPDQTLSIEIRNIDLAGRYEPWQTGSYGAYNVRFLRGVTWPRIAVRYTFEERGEILVRAEETVTDLNYQMNAGVHPYSEVLRYEKAMLDNWFKSRFVKRQPPAS